jgi:hypothetical protein
MQMRPQSFPVHQDRIVPNWKGTPTAFDHAIEKAAADGIT